jgi:hypothetical protein
MNREEEQRIERISWTQNPLAASLRIRSGGSAQSVVASGAQSSLLAGIHRWMQSPWPLNGCGEVKFFNQSPDHQQRGNVTSTCSVEKCEQTAIRLPPIAAAETSQQRSVEGGVPGAKRHGWRAMRATGTEAGATRTCGTRQGLGSPGVPAGGGPAGAASAQRNAAAQLAGARYARHRRGGRCYPDVRHTTALG